MIGAHLWDHAISADPADLGDPALSGDLFIQSDPDMVIDIQRHQDRPHKALAAHNFLLRVATARNVWVECEYT